jgi:type IV pilus assembly protein PilM
MLSIDVTDKQIRFVKGSLAGGKIKINDVETRDVPDECIVNGYITNIPPVAELITKTLQEKKISEKEIVVCVNSNSILYKELEVLKPKSLKNTGAIEAAITAHMGISNDYNVSYSIVGDGVNADGAATIKVMATACPQRMVDSYQALFSAAGLKLKQINISNNCITRLIMNTPKLKENMPFMCIQVDPDFININLYENGQVALSRYIKIDPSDYDDNPDYVNVAVFDNLFRMIQFIGQRPNSQKLNQIMFYGIIKDFVALSNSISSFGVRTYALSMPSNIVKFCDVDFSTYANAIGAFYKVDPVMEHVNLLQSSVVKVQKGVNTFVPKLILATGLSAGLVFGAWAVMQGINASVVNETKKVNDTIKAGNYDAKQAEMDLMLDVYGNFSEYRNMVEISNVLFDFLPRGSLPQILEEVRAAVEIAETNGNDTLTILDEISIQGYVINMKVYCSGTEFPADLVEALHDLDFFENITYRGFEPAKNAAGTEFELTLLLKGGHVFEANGSKYTNS